jgi:putative membrane protein
MANARVEPFHWLLLASFFALLAWSGIAPRDRFTWGLEVAPALVGAFILVAVFPRFRFTGLVYCLIWLHALVLLIGGHYTYAEMPVFNWLRDEFHASRNYYDRLGHFFQGFVPAMIAREILLRVSTLLPGKLLFFLVSCVALAISACYELLEWAVALATGDAAEAFLATQGDVWDTQWDMFTALIGALLAQWLLGARQDRDLAQLRGKQ